MAVSLQQQQGGAPGPLSDLELARQLQQEEYQQQQQLQQQQQQGSLQAAQQVTGDEYEYHTVQILEYRQENVL